MKRSRQSRSFAIHLSQESDPAPSLEMLQAAERKVPSRRIRQLPTLT